MSQITVKETAAGMGAVTNIAGNTGVATPAAGVITITTGSANTQGTAVFTASGSTVTQTFSDASQNLGLGSGALDSIVAGAVNNVAIGVGAGTAVTTGDNNVFVGTEAGLNFQSANDCVFVGQAAGRDCVQSYNTAVGSLALQRAVSGIGNCCFGREAGQGYTGAEAYNICIGFEQNGTPGESGTTRIGAPAHTTRCFINGIDNVNVGSVAKVVTTASNQLGTATITAGTGISIGTSANTITVNATGGGLTWTDVTGASSAMAINNGYQSNNAGLVTLTLPATAAFGSVIEVSGFGAGGWRIAQNAGQTIHFLSLSTTTGVGGYLESTNRYDAVKLRCAVADTTWVVMQANGNITVA